MNVTDGGGELRYVVQLMSLTRRVTIGAGVQCKCEWLVISEDMKVSAFKEMAEVFDRKIHSQQFPVEGAVAGLSGRHLPGEERDGMPDTIDILL